MTNESAGLGFLVGNTFLETAKITCWQGGAFVRKKASEGRQARTYEKHRLDQQENAPRVTKTGKQGLPTVLRRQRAPLAPLNQSRDLDGRHGQGPLNDELDELLL